MPLVLQPVGAVRISMIGGKEDDGVVEEPRAFHELHQAADLVVEQLDQAIVAAESLRVPLSYFLADVGPPLEIARLVVIERRRRHVGRMGSSVGEKEKKGLLPVSLHVADGQVGLVDRFELLGFDELSVIGEIARPGQLLRLVIPMPPVETLKKLVTLTPTRLDEARLGLPIEMPFADITCGVASPRKAMGQAVLRLGQVDVVVNDACLVRIAAGLKGGLGR